jgi:hypothetical protein
LCPEVVSHHCLLPPNGCDRIPPSPAMMSCIVLPSSHEGPGQVDGRVPLDEAHNLSHRVLRGHRQEHGHVIPHQVSLCHATCLLLGSRAKDFSQMPPPLVVKRFATIRRDKDHMILAVPLGMAESRAVWHDKLPLGRTLSGAPEGVCRFDSRNCQTVRVPRQSRGFTLIKLSVVTRYTAPERGDPSAQPPHPGLGTLLPHWGEQGRLCPPRRPHLGQAPELGTPTSPDQNHALGDTALLASAGHPPDLCHISDRPAGRAPPYPQ